MRDILYPAGDNPGRETRGRFLQDPRLLLERMPRILYPVRKKKGAHPS